jgi:hypothetical protein
MIRKLALLFCLFLVGCAPATPAILETSPTPEATSTPTYPTALPSTPFPGNITHLAWFYKPPLDGDAANLANLVDTFILTKNDEDFRDALKSAGVNAPILQYILFSAIMDPKDCGSQPYRNQVADRPGDFCQVNQFHPNWFLLDSQGNRIYSKNNAIMDPAQPEWRAFWLERARANQETLGWEGVFLDNVEASLTKQERLANGKTAYASDAAYEDAVAGFLEYLYTNYFHPQKRPLFANIIEIQDPLVWNRYLEFLDGAMLEDFALGWHGYLLPYKWEEHLRMAEYAQSRGKQVILVAQGAQDDLERQQFGFASYLLVANGLASFRYADAYGEIWMYDNYKMDLGAPLGPRYQQDGVWQRDFEKATVRVDPVWHTAEIKLK